MIKNILAVLIGLTVIAAVMVLLTAPIALLLYLGVPGDDASVIGASFLPGLICLWAIGKLVLWVAGEENYE